jgi:hypothetical protein
MSGWLFAELPAVAEPTLNLRTLVHTQPVGFRPHIEVEPPVHPLAVEQHTGITSDGLTERLERLPRAD